MRREDATIEARHNTGAAQARQAQIADLYRAGQPLAAIAEQLHSTTASIATALSAMRAAAVDLPRRVESTPPALSDGEKSPERA